MAAALSSRDMLTLRFNYFQDAVNAVVGLCLAAAVMLCVAHIDEANHVSEEETCSICGIFNVGIALIAASIVHRRAIPHLIGCYFTTELRLLYHLSSTGRSPPNSEFSPLVARAFHPG